jgi:hypothetical protein
MQDDREIGKRVRRDVFLDARQQLTRHIIAHQLRLVIDRRVAEPVAIGAIDVAACRNLHKKLRNRLWPEGGGSWIISRHGEPTLRIVP